MVYADLSPQRIETSARGLHLGGGRGGFDVYPDIIRTDQAGAGLNLSVPLFPFLSYYYVAVI